MLYVCMQIPILRQILGRDLACSFHQEEHKQLTHCDLCGPWLGWEWCCTAAKWQLSNGQSALRGFSSPGHFGHGTVGGLAAGRSGSQRGCSMEGISASGFG